MKTLKTYLRPVAYALTLFLCLNGYSQTERLQKKIFVRVYNFEGKKFSKGKVLSVSDTLLTLKKMNKIENISYEDIGSVKTKRSGGHDILIGTSVGVGISFVLAETDGGHDSFVEGYNALGTIVLGVIGSTIGTISAISKNYETFNIDGNQEKFKLFKDALMSYK